MERRMKWDISEDRPIWIQLKEQIVKKIVAGVYVSGEKLPTVRDLAKEAGVNPNTMQRALAALDQEGLVITNRTIGRVVTQEKEIIAAHRREVATGIIENFYSDMKDLGFDKEEAIKLLVQYK